MPKIAIAGTHGVGKTTLAESLANYYRDREFALNSKIARTIIANGYPLGKNATVESYVKYIILQLNAEFKAETAEIFVSDRTLLDPLAYAIVNAKSDSNNVPFDIIELLKQVWLLEVKQYDLYVLVPIEFEMEADGVRPEDDDYRIEIEERIKELLDEYKVNYICACGSVEDRVAQVTHHINKLLKKNS